MKKPASTLPYGTTFWHGTHPLHLKGIMRKGLDPAKMAPERVSEERQPYIFLDDRRQVAEGFARGVMLRVDLPKRLARKLVYDEGEFVRCPFVIAPQYITVEK